MDLQKLREQIDEIDSELIELFLQRMDISAQIAQYKQKHGIAVYDPAREREILSRLSSKAKKGREDSVAALYSLLFELSRAEQEKILDSEVI
jgi:chorismate mutase/prephenate dehydratase